MYHILKQVLAKTRKPVLHCILLSFTLCVISIVPITTQASQENTVVNLDEIKGGQYSNQSFQSNIALNATLSHQIKFSDKIIYVDFSTDPAIPNLDNQTQLQIRFINKETNSTQSHVDYKVEIMKGTNQVFSILTTHAANGVVIIPFKFQDAGAYQVVIEVDRIYFQPIQPETSTFSVFVGSLQNTNQTNFFAPSPSKTYNVSMTSESGLNQNCVLTQNCFDPPIIQITPGSRIIWTNTDTVAHTVTSGNTSDFQTGTIFASGMIPSGKTFSFTFYKINTYSYFCQVHPWMTGQIIVEPDSSTLPSTTVPEFPLIIPILLTSFFLIFALYEIKFKK